MSSYIIAGSADSIDTAYCQEIARRIKAKYKNIDFRIVIKHPSEWEQYLQQICRIYGFLKKSNPIIYTFDGKIIGNKQSFMSVTAKYFGLDEQLLIVDNLTNQVNMKIATEEINKKNIAKNNIKTLKQKIQHEFQALLKKGLVKHELKEKKEYLTNGIQYIHRPVKGLVPNISFVKNKKVDVQVQEVIASEIDLMLISQNDQIKVDQQPPIATVVVSTGKEAFVTANQKVNSEHDRMSEVSRTNKMHESMISYDKDSKQMKESSKSKSKSRIDEQNDDVTDYIDVSMKDTMVSQLSDSFFVGFYKDSHITGEMILYHNEDPNQNFLRIYNDNRPVQGHRVLIKQIHFDGQNALIQQNSQILKDQEEVESNPNQSSQQKLKTQNQQQIFVSNEESFKKQATNNLLKPKPQTQKIRTEPNLPSISPVSITHANLIHDEDTQSRNSDKNLISHLNYHTLFVQKPLSSLEIKNAFYFIKDTDCIGCLQFLPENPNPKVKLYHRKFLLQTAKEDPVSLLLPVQKFIQKQLQDGEFTKLIVPNEKCFDFESIENEAKFQLHQINDIGFQHFLYIIPQGQNCQSVAKMLKFTIDQMLSLEEQLNKQIGYNLILTKKFVMVVPLSEPYEIYNQKNLYFDGLAYLGFIHTADVLQSYQLNKKTIKNMGSHLRNLLHFCANRKHDL